MEKRTTMRDTKGSFVPVRDAVQRFQGRFDPVATYKSLRNAGLLGELSYMHRSPESTEIGWRQIGRLTLLDGVSTSNWRDKLSEFAETAERLDRKAFGYVGFDAVDCDVGTLPDTSMSSLPLVQFMIPGDILTFSDYEVAYMGESASIVEAHLRPYEPKKETFYERAVLEVVSETEKTSFLDAVKRGVRLLESGEVRKLVLSRYQAYDACYDAVDLYQALPSSVDAFLVCFGTITAVVPSPELLISVANGSVRSNPLAGTRRRGVDEREDAALRDELVSDHKEIVEHVVSVKNLLVELEPNCRTDTLITDRFMDVALQRNVQHLSSSISGWLRDDRTALDALWAVFPAVTVTGFPKAKAVKDVRSLETGPRFLYAGCIGWVSGGKNCRFSLTLRGVLRYKDRSFVQGGAGIMEESVPESEYQETVHKLRAIQDALITAVSARNVSATIADLSNNGLI